jgi:hypothetical protein
MTFEMMKYLEISVDLDEQRKERELTQEEEAHAAEQLDFLWEQMSSEQQRDVERNLANAAGGRLESQS